LFKKSKGYAMARGFRVSPELLPKAATGWEKEKAVAEAHALAPVFTCRNHVYSIPEFVKRRHLNINS
jgi:hypothetical protein